MGKKYWSYHHETIFMQWYYQGTPLHVSVKFLSLSVKLKLNRLFDCGNVSLILPSIILCDKSDRQKEAWCIFRSQFRSCCKLPQQRVLRSKCGAGLSDPWRAKCVRILDVYGCLRIDHKFSLLYMLHYITNH